MKLNNTPKFNLTKNCLNIMELIIKNDCQIYTEKQTKTTKSIFAKFYDDFVEAEEFLKTIEINPDVEEVENNNFNRSNDHNYIIKPIREYINDFAKYDITYSLKLYDKFINIFFITNNNDLIEIKRNIYRIILWLHTVIKYAKDTFCSKELNIYIFLTELEKKLPENEKEEIGKINVNTGFTMTCQEKSNIVIYRKEEWYKVFVHETMHNLGLDFSAMDNDNTRKFIVEKIFPVKSDVKLYEAYTDAWAKILNVLLTSYLTSNRTYENFRINTEEYMNLERTHCFFQCIKILRHMGLTYENLYSDDEQSKKLRKLYKEETSILSYYIINAVILNIYQEFLIWCKDNNRSGSILQFENTKIKQMEFCDFIYENYKTENMLNRIHCISEMFEHYKHSNTNKKINHLIVNMRKSLFAVK